MDGKDPVHLFGPERDNLFVKLSDAQEKEIVTFDEVERTMQFILEQQAQFAASIQRSEEERLRDAPRLLRVEAAVVELTELARTADERLDALAELARTADERLDALAELARTADRRLDALSANYSRLDEALSRLAERQAKTDANLDRYAKEWDARHAKTEASIRALSDTVDRYIRSPKKGA